MEILTLETLPKAFTQLTNEVIEIKRLLLEKSNEQPTETEQWFDLNELCNYLQDKPAKPTVYGWVHIGSIPCHKRQKKLKFLKSEIDARLKQGKLKVTADIEAEIDLFVKKKELAICKNDNTSNRFSENANNTFCTQLKIVYHILQDKVATASMVESLTGIHQKNICRYKRSLEKAGLLWQVKKDYCKITGFKAWYLTTNPGKVNNDVVQLTIF